MAIKRFTIKGNGVVEQNRTAFRRDDRLPSQAALDAVFTEQNHAENGMWLYFDVVKNVLRPAKAGDEPGLIGVLVSEETSYMTQLNGLKYHYQVGGQYGKLGLFAGGDVITSNCFSYDDGDFADDVAVMAALAAISTTPLYLVPDVGGAPKLTATKPTSGLYATVRRQWTTPDGSPAVQYVSVAV